MSCLAANVCILKKHYFRRESVAHWDSARVFFQGKSEMYLLHFKALELLGEEREGSAFLLLGTENNSFGDFVTLLRQSAFQLI